MQQKRYWLRGGLIALAIVVVLFVGLFFSGVTMDYGISIAWGVSNWPGGLVYGLFNMHLMDRIEIPIIISLSVVIYFSIGVFVGSLYGKFKNRNKVAQQ